MNDFLSKEPYTLSCEKFQAAWKDTIEPIPLGMLKPSLAMCPKEFLSYPILDYRVYRRRIYDTSTVIELIVDYADIQRLVDKVLSKYPYLKFTGEYWYPFTYKDKRFTKVFIYLSERIRNPPRYQRRRHRQSKGSMTV